MNDEIRNLPERFRPLGAWEYFGLTILYTIPIIGWIFFIVHVFSGHNINRRNFARSYMIGWLIAAVIVVIQYLTGNIDSFLYSLSSLGNLLG